MSVVKEFQLYKEGQRMIGIDKSILKNWQLESIELKKLLSKKNVIVQTTGYTTTVLDYETSNLVDIAYIKIKDKYMFNVLQFGVKYVGEKRIIYGFLDMHINGAEGKTNNLKPLLLSEYHKLVTSIEKYLIEEYGVHIDFENAKFEMLELNRTIELDRDFKEYKHLFTLMFLLAPKTYKSKHIYLDNKDNEIRGFVVNNKSVMFKLYNKTDQLLSLYKITTDKQYLRIEYVLQNSKKIESVFKGCSLFDLSDEKIKSYLIETIKKDLIKNLENHIKSSKKKLIEIAKEEKERDSRKWTRAFVLRSMCEKNNSVPILICTVQLKEIIKKRLRAIMLEL